MVAPGARPLTPVNLTAAAEPLSWARACRAIGIGGPSQAAALEVRGLAPAETSRRNDGSREALYVVIAGYGILRCGDVEVEYTGGDVLFVPRGCAHHFDPLGGDIRIWMISPIDR